MRSFNFKARNIGQERYLTYIMGEESDLDEDVLDYCEENNLKELVNIIYEEDDDYDYLTYDITGKKSVEEVLKGEVNSRQVLFLVRNVAANLISLKEQAIHLAYILLNRNFMYVDEETLDIQFICLPVESEASVVSEFKGFIRQLLAGMRYNVEEDLSYVGKLLTYINGDNFNLRGLVGLSEALMEETGISFEATGDIDADGVEVVTSDVDSVSEDVQVEMAETAESDNKVADFMNSIEDDQPLPEIGDDEEETKTEGIPSIEIEPEMDETPKAEPEADEAPKTEPKMEEAPKAEPEVEEAPKTEPGQKLKINPNQRETDVDIIKDRIRQLAGQVPQAKTKEPAGKDINTLEELDNLLDGKPPVIKKNVVKVNRAALIQSAAAELEETAELSNNENVPVIEEISENINIESDDKPKSNSILSKSVPDATKRNTLVNAPKAMPYLIRINTNERIMLGKVVFKIGKATRGVDYTVDGNGAISRQHAIITQKDGVCYIKDNKSTNHTYVNGRQLDEGIEEILTHDSMIKLGDEEFMFKIR